MRRQGGFVALQPDEADSGVRYHFQNAGKHSQPGAQHGDEDDFLFQLQAGRLFHRRADGNFFHAERARGFVGHQAGDFTQ